MFFCLLFGSASQARHDAQRRTRFETRKKTIWQSRPDLNVNRLVQVQNLAVDGRVDMEVDGRVDMEVEGILRVGTGSSMMGRLVGCSASLSCSGLLSSLPTGLIRGRTRMYNGGR